MENQDLTTGKLANYKNLAEQSVIQSGDKYLIQFKTPVKGYDTTRTFGSRNEAIEAAFNVLKSQPDIKAA